MSPLRVAVTGAGGAIGRVLRPRLLAQGLSLSSSDIGEINALGAEEQIHQGDLRDPAVVDRLLAGASVAIHLAGSSVERPIPEIIENNLVALHQLYEGALRNGVRRVVFASSNHTIGMYPSGARLRLDDPVRPDGLYGLSKVWGEAMGRLYWDKHGIETVAIRIGSALPRPTETRHLSTWLGYEDMETLFLRALRAPDIGFLAVWGVSANTASWWDNAGAEKLGYLPVQNAAEFAAEVPPAGPGARSRYQGGDFAAAGLGAGAPPPRGP
ncbi:MAG: epimerase [Acidocella sp. 20-63-7]|nr:MAG: epimerase [Acidocella sp. 20-63-7]HQT46101.1 NAD(P)-dependent oxidoreductase [Acidocella sp.]